MSRRKLKKSPRPASEPPTYRRMSEPSAWLRGAVAAFLRDHRAGIDAFCRPGVALVTPLNRDEGHKDSRVCDRCGYDTPEGPPYYPFIVTPEPGLFLVVGLCAECIKAEGEPV